MKNHHRFQGRFGTEFDHQHQIQGQFRQAPSGVVAELEGTTAPPDPPLEIASRWISNRYRRELGKTF